jgi:dienelactone hydrolase
MAQRPYWRMSIMIRDCLRQHHLAPPIHGLCLLLASLGVLACEPEIVPDPVLPDTSSDDHSVGTLRLEAQVGPGRTLPIQIWYPAVESAREAARRGRPLLEIEPPGARRDALATLLETAPDVCTTRTLHAADAPEPLVQQERFPLLVFSHCMDCMRFSSFSVAEQLARAGFVVAAPDHEGGTLYDLLEGKSRGAAVEFLEQRIADMQGTLDLMLNAQASALPAGLSGRIDASRVGAFGHSLGSVTTGFLLERDPRVRAAAMLLYPIAATGIPILDEMYVDLSKMTKPALFMLATEDNGITDLLNELIRDNYANYPAESWLVSLRDAGHYSVTDIAMIVPENYAGCGDGLREATLRPFTYMDIELARRVTGQVVVSLFQKELRGVGAGPQTLSLPRAVEVVHKRP